MTAAHLVPAAAEPLLATIRSLTEDDLARPTPCVEYDVRDLVNHLMFWAPSLVGAATRSPVPPPGPDETVVDLVGEVGWAARLEAAAAAVAAAWSEPAAWEGMTVMGAPPQFPAATVGAMVVGELVVHGWDLARATGQDVRFGVLLDPGVTDLLLAEVTANAAMGRDLGIYGPQVPVPSSAPALHRVLGLTGRSPAWTVDGAVNRTGPR